VPVCFEFFSFFCVFVVVGVLFACCAVFCAKQAPVDNSAIVTTSRTIRIAHTHWHIGCTNDANRTMGIHVVSGTMIHTLRSDINNIADSR
jgi:hypothetical protein